ncbi:hypothetical protein PCE1_004923 [Barthelona sp. PCE]
MDFNLNVDANETQKESTEGFASFSFDMNRSNTPTSSFPESFDFQSISSTLNSSDTSDYIPPNKKTTEINNEMFVTPKKLELSTPTIPPVIPMKSAPKSKIQFASPKLLADLPKPMNVVTKNTNESFNIKTLKPMPLNFLNKPLSWATQLKTKNIASSTEIPMKIQKTEKTTVFPDEDQDQEKLDSEFKDFLAEIDAILSDDIDNDNEVMNRLNSCLTDTEKMKNTLAAQKEQAIALLDQSISLRLTLNLHISNLMLIETPKMHLDLYDMVSSNPELMKRTKIE